MPLRFCDVLLGKRLLLLFGGFDGINDQLCTK
jgi:hypothetical protein